MYTFLRRRAGKRLSGIWQYETIFAPMKKDAEAYAALKTELAEKFTYDNEGYCDGKDSFVKDLERKALEWRKTMSV